MNANPEDPPDDTDEDVASDVHDADVTGGVAAGEATDDGGGDAGEANVGDVSDDNSGEDSAQADESVDGAVPGTAVEDECQPDRDDCPEYASCLAIEETYHCVCADDFEEDGDACVPRLCEGDTYDHDADPETACVPRTVCEAGAFAEDDGSSRSDRVCVECERGTFTAVGNQSMCTPHRTCEAGSYISLRGTTYYDVECEPCPANEFTDAPNELGCIACGTWQLAEPGSTECVDAVLCPWGVQPSDNDESCVGTEFRQFGTLQDDSAFDVAVTPNRNVVVVGSTSSDLVPGGQVGQYDAFVRVYDRVGTVLWTRQFGAEYESQAHSVRVDPDGRIVVAGLTFGTLADTSMGRMDIFVRVFDANGNVLWTRQFGNEWEEAAPKLAIGPSGEIVVGSATQGYSNGSPSDLDEWDAYLALLDAEGDLVWLRQFGTTTVNVHSLAVDVDGSVIIGGTTEDSLLGPNYDAVLRKYDQAGEELWTRRFGTDGLDSVNALAVTSQGNIAIAGSTTGDLGGTSAGSSDGVIGLFDPEGEQMWLRLLGTEATEHTTDLALDSSDNLVVSGYTEGGLGNTSAGGYDAFVVAYDDSGSPLWVEQFGTASRDVANGVAVGEKDQVYVAGITNGSFVEALPGGRADAYVLPLNP